MQNSRKSDKATERKMQNILDSIYRLRNISFSRVDDIQLQKRGVDLYMNINNQLVAVDEKTATSCFNRVLKTFAFEVFCKANPNNEGWFKFDDDFSLTQYYALIYPKAKNIKLEGLSSVEIIIVSKKAITDYLASIGITSKEKVIGLVKEKGYEVVVDGKVKKIVYQYNNDVRIVQSVWLREKPINIVVSKGALKRMCSIAICQSYAA